MSLAATMPNQIFTQRPILQSPMISATEGLASRYCAMADDGSQAKEKREASMQLSVAEGHLASGQTKECLEMAAQALKLFRDQKDNEGSADAATAMVNAHRQEAFDNMVKPDEAIRVATNEKAAFAKANDKRGEACMTLVLAELAVRTAKKTQDIAKALASAEEACKVFQGSDDKKKEASSQLVLSSIYHQKHKFEEAHQAADVAESLFKGLDDKKGMAKAAHAKGVAFLIPEDFANAIKSEQAALALYQDVEDVRNQAFSLSTVAQYQLMQGKPHNSLRTAKEAYAIAKQLTGIKYPEVFALLLKCESLLAREQFKDAVKEARAGLANLEDSGDKYGVVAGLEILLHCELSSDEPKDALTTCKSALKRVKEYEDKHLELNMLYTICRARMKNGKDEAAVENMRDAATLAKELGDVEDEADTLRMESYIRTGSTDLANQPNILGEAVDAATSARSLYKEMGHPAGEASSLMLTMYLKAQGYEVELDELVGLAKDAMALYRDAEDVMGEHNALNSIVDLHLTSEKYEEALDAAVSSVGLWKATGKKRAQAEAMSRVAQIYLERQYSEDAVHECTEALSLCREVGAVGLEAKLQLMLAQAYVADMAKMEVPTRDPKDPLPEAFLELRARALTAVKDGLLLAGKASSKPLRASALFWRSQVLIWGFTDKALDALRAGEEAERIFGQIKDFKGQAHAMVLCADLHFLLGQNKESKSRANAALQLVSTNAECRDAEQGAMIVLNRMEPQQQQQQGGEWQPDQPQEIDWGALAAMQGAGGAPVLDKATITPKVFELIAAAAASDDDIELDTPFFDAGLDSLSSVQFTGDIGREFSVSLAPSATFDYPSARSLIDHIIEESGGN